MRRTKRRRLELVGGLAAILFVLAMTISKDASAENAVKAVILVPMFGGLVLFAYMWIMDRVLGPKGG